MNRKERRHLMRARIGASHRHGRPMPCPTCGNDIYLDVQHICTGVTEVRPHGVLRFYGYQSLNRCCREWMLLGWPEVNGKPKAPMGEDPVLTVDCQKCSKALHFAIYDPLIVYVHDCDVRGTPDPPAIVPGRITGGKR